jgi:hypothetical protein
MREVFVRSLGAIYVFAFASLSVQVLGLVGADGLLPAHDFLAAAHRSYGAEAYWLFPTLCWLSASDAMLQALCAVGGLASFGVVVGLAPALGLSLAWSAYLSLSVAGQAFLSFQWDTLLLEAGLLGIFFAPGGLWPRPATRRAASPLVRWMLWLLLFKLMFLSGVTKLLSGDPVWSSWTALGFHYETQPLPTWTSWYAHLLPTGLQRACVGFMWLAELIAPFAIFAPVRVRWVRWVGCGVMLTLQLGIAATGNYGFFNLLAAALCLTLLDDDVWGRLGLATASETPARPPRGARIARAVAAACLLPLSLLAFLGESGWTPRALEPGGALSWTRPVVASFRPLRSVNGYGLFRVMTTERRELAVEGQTPSGDWVPYPFRWKVGAPERVPRFAGPHMPRLDWQMWFAALDPGRQERWLMSLAHHLLSGTPEVRSLLGPGPFESGPPQAVRFVLDRYRFTRWGEEGWWSRERLGPITRPLSLPVSRTRGPRGDVKDRVAR